MWKAEARVNDWQEVYRRIGERLVELKMSLADLYRASMSEGTFQAMKRGTPVTYDYNRAKICAALKWTPDSLDRILDGLAPEEIREPSVADELRGLLDRIAQIEARLALLEPPPHPGDGAGA